MMVKKSQIPQAIIDATMALAAEEGWQAVSLADIAARAGVTMADVYAHFPSKTAILEAYLRDVDERMLRGDLPEGTARDRLFDVVMRRFDAMAEHKEGLRAIARDGGFDPLTAASGLRRFMRSVALILEAAGISTTGLGGLARIEGMAAVYLYALRAWLRDDTEDLSKTMAALDRALRGADTFAGLLWRRRRPAAPPSPPPETAPQPGG